MAEEVKEVADRRLEEALEKTGARDPREFYRERLKELKREDPGAYDRAVAHYQDVLLPSVAEEGVPPLEAWTEYGRKLAELTAPGRTVCVDGTGRASPYEAPAASEALVLHIPDSRRGRPLLVGLPAELSPAQRATYDWLVSGRRGLRD